MTVGLRALYIFHWKVFQHKPLECCVRFPREDIATGLLPVYGSLLFVIIDLIRCKRNSPNVEAIDSACRVFQLERDGCPNISFASKRVQAKYSYFIASLSHTQTSTHFQIEANNATPSKSQKFQLLFFFPRFYTYPHIHLRSMLFTCDKCTKFFRQHSAVGIYIVLRLFVSMSMPLYLCASFRVVRPYNDRNFGGSDCWLPLFCDK